MTLANSYLDIAGFKARTIAPSSLVDGAHIPDTETDELAAWQTFIESQLQIETSKINSRLFKRYNAPFVDPVPEIVLGWLTVRVTPKLYQRRGWDPSDAQAIQILDDAKEALDEMLEAANAVEGLFDLPLRNDSSKTGITRGGPLVYSEPGPYEWTDRQVEALNGRR